MNSRQTETIFTGITSCYYKQILTKALIIKIDFERAN